MNSLCRACLLSEAGFLFYDYYAIVMQCLLLLPASAKKALNYLRHSEPMSWGGTSEEDMSLGFLPTVPSGKLRSCLALNQPQLPLLACRAPTLKLQRQRKAGMTLGSY
jgi:hypothetical protein